MSTYLLDVNALIALIDPAHVMHARAGAWFEREGSQSWATCPIVENGVLRIVSQRSYGNRQETPGLAAEILADHRALGDHSFWPDDVSLLDPILVDWTRLSTSAQVTDSYLLALAKSKGGLLATLDRRLVVSAIPDGQDVLHLIH